MRQLSWQNFTQVVLVEAFLTSFLFAQAPPPRDRSFVTSDFGIETFPLWSGAMPGAGESPNSMPTLTAFLPQPGKANGTAVVVAPGGAYIGLAINLEGRQVADWFTARGITAFVLTYRLGRKNLYPIPLLDAQRAIRLVRSLDKKYGLSSHRVGIIGFSAGGHLAAAVGTLFGDRVSDSTDPVDALSDRPDFLMLGYPWLNAMQPNEQKKITYCSLIKSIPAADCKSFEQLYTPALHVSAATPPTFIYHTTEDSAVPVQASVDFFDALVKAGVPAEMHIFAHGAHGTGLGAGDQALDLWPILLEAWLRAQGLLEPDPTATPAAQANIAPPAQLPGERLSLNSRISDIAKDPAVSSLVDRICGSDFLSSLPSDTLLQSLKNIAPYFPELSATNLQKIAEGLSRLPPK